MKMEILDQNSKVALEFEYDTCNTIATVVALGRVVGTAEVENSCGSCDCCGQTCVSIEIEADEISGREFFKCCGGCNGCTIC